MRPLRSFASIALAAALLAGVAPTHANDTPTTRPAAFDREAIAAVMRRVADRQLLRNAEAGRRDPGWVRATLYPGVLATHDVTGDPRHLDETVRWAREEGNWTIPGRPSTQPARGRRFADNQAIGWTYAELSRRLNEPAHRADVERVLAEVAADEAPGRVDWWWCDALYMAPPVLTRMAQVTGDAKYLALNDRLFWDTVDFLYDPDERLIYRDKAFFAPRVDGRKVFWSRGNGWTLGALARVLRDLPEDHPTRPRYVELFGAMSERVAELQPPDGLWRSNLLVPAQFPNPESSGTALFVFALASGVNDGLLDRARFEPTIRRGWLGLLNCVQPDGTLGYVQPVGHDPRPATPTRTQEYAVGAFLLAGKEVVALGPPAPGTDALPAPLPPTTQPDEPRAHAMFVPQRMDDFAWENDVVAFRAYGPALQKQDGPQSGLDLWLKRTGRLVQQKWYAGGDYHTDHGEGLDGYKVGGSRGCGGTAVVRGDKLYPGANYATHEIAENGPDRVVFTLTYPPHDCGGVTVTERKKITLDAGTHFNKVESTFTFDGPPIEVAVGVKIHPQAKVLTPPGGAARYVAAWEPVDGEGNGHCGVAAIVPGDAPLRVVERDGDLLAITRVTSGVPLTYYAGGGWSKAGFADADHWLLHVQRKTERLEAEK